MGRKKSEIQADINEQNSLINANNAKIKELQAALTALNNATTTVDWVEKSHGQIKENRHLAGTPYLNMSNDEGADDDSILKTCQDSLDDKISDMREIVASQLRNANSYGMDLAAGLGSLEIELEGAKD